MKTVHTVLSVAAAVTIAGGAGANLIYGSVLLLLAILVEVAIKFTND